MPLHPLPRVVVPALLAVLVAGCPQPDHPLGLPAPPPPPPPAPAATIAFRVGAAGLDRVQAVAVDAAGGIYIAGSFTGTVDFDPSSATRLLTSLATPSQVVARYSASGDLAWAFQLGDSPDDEVAALAIDDAGNVIIGGSFAGTIDLDPGAGTTIVASQGGRDAFVASYAADGTLRWTRAFGGVDDDAILGVSTEGSDVHAAGSFAGTVAVDPSPGMAITSAGGVDGFLAAWTTGGGARWVFSVGGLQDDAATVVTAGDGGSIYLGGSFTGTADFGPGALTTPLTSQGSAGLFLARYRNDGSVEWARGLSGTSSVQLALAGLAADGGGVHVAGSFSGTVDFDAGTGVTTRSSLGPTDGFLVHYDAAGSFGWVVAVGGTGATQPRGVAVGASGDVVVTGAFSGTARFDPGLGATTRTAIGLAGATDAFTAQYSSTGAFRWVVGMGAPVSGGESASYHTAVAVDGSGSVVGGGQFFGAADVDPGAGVVILTSLGGADGLVIKLTGTGALATRP